MVNNDQRTSSRSRHRRRKDLSATNDSKSNRMSPKGSRSRVTAWLAMNNEAYRQRPKTARGGEAKACQHEQCSSKEGFHGRVHFILGVQASVGPKTHALTVHALPCHVPPGHAQFEKLRHHPALRKLPDPDLAWRGASARSDTNRPASHTNRRSRSSTGGGRS